jgi:hypothetical protein
MIPSKGRVGGAVHLKQDFVGSEARHAGRVLVADVERYAWIS